MNNGFLTIGELCQRVEIRPHTLRYWEKKFSDFLRPYRSKGGHRRYGQDEAKILLKIKELVRDKRYTIKGAREALNGNEWLRNEGEEKVPRGGSFFLGKRILITGGTGTVGREITRHLLTFHPSVVRIYSRDETKQFEMRQEFEENDNLRYFIGDVRDGKRLRMAMEDIDIVFHLAALKHVMACEYNPFEAVNTNIYGSQNVINAALDVDVERVIFTSTDKVVNPSSTMGATKLMAEKLFTAANYYKGRRRVIFASLRFGNILGSRGSVVSLFKNQALNGGSITITDRNMTRFIMSLGEAVELIFKAAFLARGGETFVLKMSIAKIIDLVRAVQERLAVDNNIKEIGITPGEKLYEELMTREEKRRALETDDMYIILPAIRELRKIEYSYPGAYIPQSDNHLTSEKGPFLDREEIKNFLQRESLV